MPDAGKLHVKVPNAVSNTAHHITSHLTDMHRTIFSGRQQSCHKSVVVQMLSHITAKLQITGNR